MMRPFLLSTFFFFACSIASAESAPYCPDRTHNSPVKTPVDLTVALAKAFEMSPAVAGDASYVRCVGPKLMGCAIGANLVCDKADKRRALPGATAWCHDNPDAPSIPMAATGHGTIYEWSCKGSEAVAGKEIVKVDAQGFIADNWKEIH
jgi:hypothetical protein